MFQKECEIMLNGERMEEVHESKYLGFNPVKTWKHGR